MLLVREAGADFSPVGLMRQCGFEFDPSSEFSGAGLTLVSQLL